MTMSVLGTHGYQRTLEEMKRRLGHMLGWKRDSDVPSPSALCQARKKLTLVDCRNVVRQVYDLCTTARQCAGVGYGQLRLIALDGTNLMLPAYAALRNHFGCPSQGDGRELRGPQASLTVLWDVGSSQPIDWSLDPYATSEQQQARELAGSLRSGDLLLADRNFFSRRFLTQVTDMGADVLMRVRASKAGALNEVINFLASSADEVVVEIAARDVKNRPIPDRPAIRVRLLRATLPTGETAVYLTTLIDARRHPAATLIKLYTARWRIETAFREMKLWHGLERFHARNQEGIAQEVAALMLFQLLASEVEAQARLAHPEARVVPETTNQSVEQLQWPKIRFNRRLLADCAVDLIYAAANGDDIRTVLEGALYRLWRYRQHVKPGRSFPREKKSPPRGWKPRGTKGKGRPKKTRTSNEGDKTP